MVQILTKFDTFVAMLDLRFYFLFFLFIFFFSPSFTLLSHLRDPLYHHFNYIFLKKNFLSSKSDSSNFVEKKNKKYISPFPLHHRAFLILIFILSMNKYHEIKYNVEIKNIFLPHYHPWFHKNVPFIHSLND